MTALNRTDARLRDCGSLQVRPEELLLSGQPKNYQISQYRRADLRRRTRAAARTRLSARRAERTSRGRIPAIALTRSPRGRRGEEHALRDLDRIDFNRAGTPLMEIVSEPDIQSPEEALPTSQRSSRSSLWRGERCRYGKGQLRCDCNVSVRPEGQGNLAPKIEIKNMNSISGVRRAIAPMRSSGQMECAPTRRTARAITRRWDDAAGQTFQMRTKESAHDYRYFPIQIFCR
jgi:aspartyl-tRNA(Asn)/glutamyl-tRNA(Gln) amidotransferase subunit B